MSNIKKIYTCSYCSKTFSKPSALRPHLYTHTGEKPYTCHVDGCGRQFSVVSNLRRHFKVHAAAVNKSALSTRQQRQTQHSGMIAPQHRMIRISPPPMPRRLLPAIPSSLPVSATPMINVTTPSITDDIATTTTLASPLPPSCMLSFNHGDNNSHMPMWMNPYPFTAQSFIDNNNDINNNGATIMVTNNTISVPPPPCSTNLFSFKFYYMNTTTESSMTTYYANNDNSTSRTLSSHVYPSFL